MGNYLCNSPGCGAIIGTDEELPQTEFCDTHEPQHEEECHFLVSGSRKDCDCGKALSWEEWHDALASFGKEVLSILENEKDWSADTLEQIAQVALQKKIARHGANSLFCAVEEPDED